MKSVYRSENSHDPQVTDTANSRDLTAQEPGTPILEARHLSKEFPVRGLKFFGPRRAVHALDDASLALYPERALALVGESGCGKTTMARLLAHLYLPTSGEILFQDQLVNVRGGAGLQAYRKAVQLIFQDPFGSLNPVHTVAYHLSRPLRLHGQVRDAADERQQLLSLLERVNLTPAEQFIEKYPHQLSGGQRQRVAIARALAVRPAVLLADEPVSMLDVSIRLDILNLLLRLKREEHLAFLFITHDIASARYFAEDTVVMYAGQMVEGGPSEEVIQQPHHPYTKMLLAAAPDPDRLLGSAVDEVASEEADAPVEASQVAVEVTPRGEAPSLINLPTGCHFHPRCPHAMPVCREQFPPRTDLGAGHWTHCFLYNAKD